MSITKNTVSTIYTETPVFKSMPPIDLANTSKEQFTEYLLNSFYLYEYLFSALVNEEAYHQVPEPLRRHLMFYIGHTATVYLNKFKLFGLAQFKNEFFDKVFAVGVDPIKSEELDHQNYNAIWPKLDEVYAYRKEILDMMLGFIEKEHLTLPVQKDSFYWVLNLAIEHERIHFETTLLLFRQLDLKFLKKPEKWSYAEYSTESFPENEFLEIAQAHKVRLGKPQDFPTFGWDNEYGEITLITKPFKATKFKISNGEFLEFVKANGYREKKFWRNEGWEWLQRTDKDTYKKEILDCPIFWIKNAQAKFGFKLRLVFDEIELPLNWPVEVNYHEARAYCAWLQEKHGLKSSFYRVIKEEEFKIIRGDEILIEKNGLRGAQKDFVAFNRELGNTHCEYISPTAVDKYAASPLGFYDTVGNVWEWSESYFRAFPGFKPETFYFDFSGPCFDFYHNNMMGSAWSSTGMSASFYTRINFRRHFYQNCGFRVVEEEIFKGVENDLKNDNNNNNSKIGQQMISNYYESSTFSSQHQQKSLFAEEAQLDFEINNYKDFGTKIASQAVRCYQQINNLSSAVEDLNLSALVLGCGVGKSAFELAKSFSSITGLESSKAFIDVCNELKETGKYKYKYNFKAESFEEATASIAPEIDRTRVEFVLGDPCNLANELGPFDLIIVENLLEKTQNPKQCLIDLHNKLNNKGILIIGSSLIWSEEHTAREFWIGGKDGVSAFDALKELMEGFCFNLADQKTLSMISREHSLKYQIDVSVMTVWTKRKFNAEFATTIFKKKQN